VIERDRVERQAGYRIRALRCRRTGAWLAPEDHLRCPYCRGEREDVLRGLYGRFCDFRERRDPVHFGFPPGGARELHG
jgi:hypothetical protein